ncbi:MAG: twin-arginine translocase TatA/TatE family subunit [Candidatus Aureabacteria bacterium]|nr:twin-arginine translocase TatA/TatE family subunit [Candidatus Auribacterota bacterium]
MALLPLAFLESFGFNELLVILFIILLLFGAKRLPELMRSLGKGAKEFKKGMSETEDDKEKDERKPPTP